MQKLDSYLASLGVNLGRTGTGMSGAALAVMAGRIAGRAAGRAGAGTADGGGTFRESVRRNGGKGENGEGIFEENSDFMEGAGPIPMPGSNPGQKQAGRTGGVQAEDGQGAYRADSGDSRYRQDGEETSGGGTGKDFEGTGIRSSNESDGELWASLQEEAAAMDAAAGSMGGCAEEIVPKDGEGYDTGILSCPVPEEEDTGMPGMDCGLREWNRGADSTE